MRIELVSSLLLALLVPDVVALTVKDDGLPPCGHKLCTCCHGDAPEGNMLCARSSSRESSAIKACEDDSESAPSQSVYLLETPMALESEVALVTNWIPSSCTIRPWASTPDFPPPRS